MEIRKYGVDDETEWLKCRVLSFLDSSYYSDVLTKREVYANEAICLVAEDNGKIVGLIDAEIEKHIGDLCVAGNKLGAVIWHLAVLPEYRQQNIATTLWNEVQKLLTERCIHYCEAWTQEDEPANHWYIKQGFHNIEEKNWLRCYARPSSTEWFLNTNNVGDIFGVEEMIFEVSTSRKNEISRHCQKIIEVRLYAKEL